MRTSKMLTATGFMLVISLFLLSSSAFARGGSSPEKMQEKLVALQAQEYSLMVDLEFAPLEDRDAIFAELLTVRDNIVKLEEKINNPPKEKDHKKHHKHVKDNCSHRR